MFSVYDPLALTIRDSWSFIGNSGGSYREEQGLSGPKHRKYGNCGGRISESVRQQACFWGILFFDEPTSGLDYKHMKEVANVLKQVRDAGITLYVITHDLELLLDCCTDIVHFEDGSIIDKFQMDEAGLEKIRNYFIKGVPTK